ncbi:MAG: two-component system cell cycle sensor histidine kinase/response regulator CckA [Paracoccaceae bacterium]|jgi:two-component system cell cycle sensor histidine kinase/response regulator CckA
MTIQADVPWSRRGGMAVAALGFGLIAAIAAMAAMGGAPHLTPVSLMAAATIAGVVTAGGAGFALIVLARRREGREEGAFGALLDADHSPALLTDAYGVIIAANEAARSGDSSAAPGTRIADLLRGPRGRAEQVSYVMLRELRRGGVSRRRLPGPGGVWWDAVAADMGAGRVLWRLRPATIDGAGVELSDLPPDIAALRLRDGEMHPNAAMTLLLSRPGETLEEVFSERPEGEICLRRLSSPAAGVAPLRRVVTLGQQPGADPSAETTILVLPCDADEDAAALDGPLARTLDGLPVALARLDLTGRLLTVNAPARALLGDKAETGAEFGLMVEGLGRSVSDRVQEAARGLSSGRSEVARARRDDKETFLQISLSRVMLDGAPSLIAVISDATELKTLEAQFVQSQKMQAVGQLAGGVAHDFNNLLTAINGHCDLLLMRHETTDPDHADLTQIRQNANRAASLVRQMLAFSRKQTLRPKVLSLVETLAELSHLLNRLLGEKVRLHLDHEDDLGLVRVDERQFEQVVMNLVVNARDAMPEGGDVRIRTRNVDLDQELRRDRAVVPPGAWVLVEVSDSGEGIAPDKIANIFEPFFTTKKVGEGTGLGLSTAYGIIKQTGGFIFADSQPGRGAVFSVWLPRLEEEDGEMPVIEREPEPRAPAPLTSSGPAGVVLLVEDEAPVRSFATRALQLRGWEVIEAESAEMALELLEDKALVIDVIISDVVMPGMDGPTWVKQARLTRPDVKVIFVSGYAEDAFQRNLEGLTDFNFLPKPFSLIDLADAMANI